MQKLLKIKLVSYRKWHIKFNDLSIIPTKDVSLNTHMSYHYRVHKDWYFKITFNDYISEDL